MITGYTLQSYHVLMEYLESKTTTYLFSNTIFYTLYFNTSAINIYRGLPNVKPLQLKQGEFEQFHFINKILFCKFFLELGYLLQTDIVISEKIRRAQ